MKTELLVLVSDEESFCKSRQAFVDLLKVDSLISIAREKISYRRSERAKFVIEAKFRVKTGKVKSKQERYFQLTLESQDLSQDSNQIDDFKELCDRVRMIVGRISPENITVNTLWDDVGRIYAEKSYPLINEVENLMRKLIAEFMLITVGLNWSQETMHPDLSKKIENFGDTEPYLNDLYKLDFIHLNHFLFEKKRDISLEEMDRILVKTEFNDVDREKIRRYIPRSNWEKYFSILIDEKESSLEKKWELLYKLRNKVAHNRHIKKEDYDKIKGLSSKIKEVITKSSEKLSEIDLSEEDRESIIFSYNSNSPKGFAYFSEQAVVNYYSRAGYEIPHSEFYSGGGVDFYAVKDETIIAVEVKAISSSNPFSSIKSAINQIIHLTRGKEITEGHLVFVLREEHKKYPVSRMFEYADKLTEEIGQNIKIYLGKLDNEGNYIPYENSIGTGITIRYD